MLSTVTLNCQPTKIVMNPGSLWRCFLKVFVFVIVFVFVFVFVIVFLLVMSPHHSDQMCPRSQVSRVALWRCSLNVFVFVIVFVFVFVFVFVIVFLLVRSCPLINLIRCLKGHKSLGSLFSVLKSKGHRVSERVTRSSIQLLWTAKNLTHCVYDVHCTYTFVVPANIEEGVSVDVEEDGDDLVIREAAKPRHRVPSMSTDVTLSKYCCQRLFIIQKTTV